MSVQFTSLLDRAAYEHLAGRELLPSFSHYDVWLYEHSVGFAVAKMMDMDLLAETKAALQTAMQNGTAYRDFEKRLKPFLMARGWWGEQVMTDPADGVAKTVQLGSTRRLRVIFQTNMATAYAAGRWQRIQEYQDDFPFLKYIPSVAEQKRQSHMSYYNRIWRVDDPIWQTIYPPNGYGCQCTVRQLTEKQALRERSEDIAKNPDAFDSQQLENHRKGVIEDGQEHIEWVEFTNPRTGQTVQVPFDITPTFAHNHGDRLGALQKLAHEKHGTATAEYWQKRLQTYLLDKLDAAGVRSADLASYQVREDEIARLLVDILDNKPKPEEAELADKLQQHLNVRLERYPVPPPEKGKKSLATPDFVISEENLSSEEMKTVDLMFTLAPDGNVNEFLRSFNKSATAWEKRKAGIIKHLDKADIIPMYLKHFDTATLTKILSLVLQLPERLQQKIILVWD